jgi:hypothetical protein
MASSKEDGTAAAADQLGSMSIGDSMERKGNDETEPNTKNGTPTKKLCSACGEKSNALMKCRACKCVWYCDKDCQNKHWKEHKKECKRIKKELEKRGGKLDLGNEKDLGSLPDLPQREECPICMQVLPIQENQSKYYGCCGKTICCACDRQHSIKNKERAAKRGQKSVSTTCAFCRTTVPKSDEEVLAQLSKRVELKDPYALVLMGFNYWHGQLGLPVDQAKCVALYRESAGLGCPSAQFQLGAFYHEGSMGLEQNKEEGLKYFKKAADGGHLLSRHNLAFMEAEDDNDVAAMRHLRLAAPLGYKLSMAALINYFYRGSLHHADLAETLQAFYRSRAEMKSEGRDKYAAYLKRIGEYEAEYDSS